MSPASTPPQPESLFPDILRLSYSLSYPATSYGFSGVEKVIFVKKGFTPTSKLLHEAWSRLSLRSNLDSESVSWHFSILESNSTGTQKVSHTSNNYMDTNCPYNSILMPLYLEIAADSIALRPLSHKIVPLSISYVSIKPRLLPEPLTKYKPEVPMTPPPWAWFIC